MGDGLANVRLVLFFTRGLSLRVWDEIGILSREAALYRRLAPVLRRITFVTYGDNDRAYQAGWAEFESSPIVGASQGGAMSSISKRRCRGPGRGRW